MAKVKGGTVSFSVKLGDKVFVKGRKNNEHIRHAPGKKPLKKVMEILSKNARRTQYLNLLASELNNIIHAYWVVLKAIVFIKACRAVSKANRRVTGHGVKRKKRLMPNTEN